MHDYWIEFGKVAAAHLLAMISPGPDFAVVLRQSLGYGRRAAVWTSSGIGAAILLHVSYSLTGIGLLIRQSPVWFDALKILGAAYVGWMGLQALRARPEDWRDRDVRVNGSCTRRAAFLTGFLTNALNPKAAMFFVALFATVISADTPKWAQATYGAWMWMATTAWFSFVAVVVTRADVRARFLKYGHWVSRVLGGVLVAFAVGLLLSKWL